GFRHRIEACENLQLHGHGFIDCFDDEIDIAQSRRILGQSEPVQSGFARSTSYLATLYRAIEICGDKRPTARPRFSAIVTEDHGEAAHQHCSRYSAPHRPRADDAYTVNFGRLCAFWQEGKIAQAAFSGKEVAKRCRLRPPLQPLESRNGLRPQ